MRGVYWTTEDKQGTRTYHCLSNVWETVKVCRYYNGLTNETLARKMRLQKSTLRSLLKHKPRLERWHAERLALVWYTADYWLKLQAKADRDYAEWASLGYPDDSIQKNRHSVKPKRRRRRRR